MVFGALYAKFIVDTKSNNTELCKAISKLVDEDNKYYVLMDNAIDNPDVLREAQRLYYATKDKKNVSIIKVHSFEFVLLSFKLLEKWMFAEDDELKDKRARLFEIKDIFVDLVCNGGDSSTLSSIKEELDSESCNTEQLSSKLLFQITRNTGFETGKGKLGDCFVVDCCDWKARGDDDNCGLDETRLTSDNKIRQIVENSVLKDAFAKAGL